MANNWFEFKEFKIQQEKCGMKVSTDACIQGALAADYLLKRPELNTVLDIGTGTGLLSLMLIQKRTDLVIDAIEIEENSFEQASENFKDSRWSAQLTAHHSAVQNWQKEKELASYDFIICNPPFFHNHLQSEQRERNAARHTVSLSSADLINAVLHLLKDDGIFCLLFPKSAWDQFATLAKGKGLFLSQLVFIKPKAHLEANRIIAFFSKQVNFDCILEDLIIYEAEKEYTTEFKQLLKDYYLKL